jgi:hypothetical protein
LLDYGGGGWLSIGGGVGGGSGFSTWIGGVVISGELIVYPLTASICLLELIKGIMSLLLLSYLLNEVNSISHLLIWEGLLTKLLSITHHLIKLI